MSRLDFREVVIRITCSSDDLRRPLQAPGRVDFFGRPPRIAQNGMRIVAERGRRYRRADADLTSADVEAMWRRRRDRVVPAFRNFAALRFVRLPVDGSVDGVIDGSLRHVVNTVGRRADLSMPQRTKVYEAALIAVGGLPLGMALPSPFGILDELDQIVAAAPEVSAALLEVWTIIDDREFWSSRRG